MVGQFGYTGNILRVDLSSGHVALLPTKDYADKFVGGIGVAAKIYWDEVSPDVKAFDPENCVIFATGPLAGIKGVAGPRWEICAKSPASEPEQFGCANVGGRWGARLKFAGYDAVIIRGQADKPACIVIQDGVVAIRDASHLWGKGAIEARQTLKDELGSSVSVAAIGPAGENGITFANIIADDDASASCGLGAVMGSKRLKAIAVGGSGKTALANPERFRQLTKHIGELRRGFTSSEEIGLIPGPKMRKDYCYGCPGGCFRAVFEATDGKKGKFMCHSGLFYQELARRYYGEWNEVPFYANKLCDEYGLDTYALQPILIWLSRCCKEGVITGGDIGIQLSQLGSIEFIEALVRKISLRDGFGDVLARGVSRAADMVGEGTEELLPGYVMKDRILPHDPRVYITTGLLYATEPRPSPSQFTEIMDPVIHWLNWVRKEEHAYLSSEVLRGIARKFFGSELAVDFSTYLGKSLAAKKIQDREYVKDSLILCSFAWPVVTAQNSEDHIGDPTLESQLFSAVTGRETDEEELYVAGERIFNLQRAILAREGHSGRAKDTLPEYLHTRPIKRLIAPYNPDCLVPGKEGEVISRSGAVMHIDGFERMKDEYYQLRGWDVASGLQTSKKLNELGLKDITVDLEYRGLVV
jgi:aldehyde:ferredoxin oxidoreductase